jgi:hypothetical protein
MYRSGSQMTQEAMIVTKGPDKSIWVDGWMWSTLHHMFVNVFALAYRAEEAEYFVLMN